MLAIFKFRAFLLFLPLSILRFTRGQPSCRPTSATQSNTWGTAYASRAIDSDTSTCSVSGDSLFASSFGWWQADLGSVFTVYTVTVTSGYDISNNGSWPFYAQNFSISVGLTNSTEIVNSDLCYYYNENCYLKAGVPTTFVCSPSPPRGRYVTLKRRGGDRQDAISLCEVSVQCEQPPSSSSASTSHIFPETSFSTTSGYSTAETTSSRPGPISLEAIAAIVLGSVLLLSLIINAVLIFRLTRLKSTLQTQENPYTVPKRENNNEQPNQYAALSRSSSQRDSIFPTETGDDRPYRNAYELEERR